MDEDYFEISTESQKPIGLFSEESTNDQIELLSVEENQSNFFTKENNLNVHKPALKNKKIFFYNEFYYNSAFCKINKKLIHDKLTEKIKKKSEAECSHCKSDDTPLWRYLDEVMVCNACWLYFKSHKTKRPNKLSEKGIVRRRKRNLNNL